MMVVLKIMQNLRKIMIIFHDRNWAKLVKDQDTFFMMTNPADDDPWYSALSAAFKKHKLEVLVMVMSIKIMFGKRDDVDVN